MEKIFYNSSMPRAGSTLIQNILGQNPDFYVTPTSGVLELIFGARMNYTNSNEFKAQDVKLMEKGFLGFCEEGMKGFYNNITDKKYIVDKSRGWGIHRPFLIKIFNEEPKIICMVRDLREIITSMEKKYRAHPEQQSHIVNHGEFRGTTTFKRSQIWLNGTPVGMALERLTEIITQGYDKKIFFIRYEDLLTSPNETMKDVYNYLGVDFYLHDFTNIEQITVEDDNVYGIYGDHNIKKELGKVKYDYKNILDAGTIDYITKNYQWYFKYFSYF